MSTIFNHTDDHIFENRTVISMMKELLLMLLVGLMIISTSGIASAHVLSYDHRFGTNVKGSGQMVGNNACLPIRNGATQTYMTGWITKSSGPWELKGYLRVHDNDRGIGGKTITIRPLDIYSHVYQVTTNNDGSYYYYIGYAISAGFTGMRISFNGDDTYAASSIDVPWNG
jgi:hypothetical protein